MENGSTAPAQAGGEGAAPVAPPKEMRGKQTRSRGGKEASKANLTALGRSSY